MAQNSKIEWTDHTFNRGLDARMWAQVATTVTPTRGRSVLDWWNGAIAHEPTAPDVGSLLARAAEFIGRRFRQPGRYKVAGRFIRSNRGHPEPQNAL